MIYRTLTVAALCLAAPSLATLATAQQSQTLPIAGSVTPYRFDSKTSSNRTPELRLVDEHHIRRPGASFLQVEFTGVRLSEESVLEITGLADGERQTFEFDTWSKKVPHSAYFNGDSLRVRLWAGPGAIGDRFSIRSLGVGNTRAVGPLSLCGSRDTRVLRSDTRIARALIRRGTTISWCTAFLISRNNCFATTGACFSSTPSLVTVQFRVPLSSSSGSIRHPSVAFQYNWTGISGRRFERLGAGRDWGIFTTQPNSSTRRHVGATRNPLTTLATSNLPSTARVTGFGTRSSPRTWNGVSQSDTGTLRKLSGTTLKHRADTTSGSIGAPIMSSSGSLAFGIHTHGGCTSFPLTSNSGTSFLRSTFASAKRQLCRTPDLAVMSISSPTVIETGLRYRMSMTVRNVGLGSTGSTFPSSIVLSPNSTISTSDVLLRMFTTPSLAGSRSYTYTSSSITIPSSTKPGTCYIGGIADSLDRIGESNELNNTLGRAVTCTGPLPNLTPLSVSVSTQNLVAGRPFSVTHKIANTGRANAGTTFTGVYLSNNSTISTVDELLKSILTTGIAANTTRQRTDVVVAPTLMRTQTCHIGIVVDRTHRLREGNERDNASKGIPMTCKALPDLIVTAASTSNRSAWFAGQLQTIAVTIHNRGRADAPTSNVTVQVGSASLGRPNGIFLGHKAIPALAAGKSFSTFVTVRHPYCYRSTRNEVLAVVADGFQRVTEATELNNGRTLSPSRPQSRYTGSQRVLEFTEPRAGNSNGPYSFGAGTFSVTRGSRQKMCVTAPRHNGYWVLPVWSRSPSSQIAIDDLTNLSLALPLYAPRVAQVRGNYADFEFRVPKLTSFKARFTAYTHTVWIDPSFKNIVFLSGTNRVLNSLRP